MYAVMVGIGFATAENILYVMNGDQHPDLWPLMTSVPANAVFAVIMGFFLGEAKLFPNRMLVYSVLALLAATFVHGFYDYSFYLTHIKWLWVQAMISLSIVWVLTYFAMKWRKGSVIKQE